jgi:hypothetical protein
MQRLRLDDFEHNLTKNLKMETKSFVVEYLIIIKQEDTFCDSDKAFLKFLGVDSSIAISEKDNQITINLKKNHKFTVSYTLFSDLVPSQKERYFKLTILSKDNDKIKEFDELTTLLEKIISKLHTEVSINVLWNDIARQYAIEGYTLINEVENLLRRLIANFMLTKVGYDYPKYHIPSEVGNRESHLKINYSDYLHQTYFSDLKTILFEGQRDFNFRNIGDIQKLVERYISENKKEITVNDLQGVISKSLWEKYFAKDTNYKKKDLEEDLEKLNVLRNEIAHNRHINIEKLGKIRTLSKKIIKTLNLEIDDLPNKSLTVEQQKFQVNTENIRIAEKNMTLQGYLAEQALFEWYILKFGLTNVVLSTDDMEVDIMVRTTADKRIAVQTESTTLNGFRQIRNQIAHGINLERLIPKNSSDYFEFHLAIILRDYTINSELIFAKELSNLLTSISQNIKLIVGYIDENNKFVQVI